LRKEEGNFTRYRRADGLHIMSRVESSDYREFPATHWSLVDRAATHSHAQGAQALEALLQRYLPALKTHLIYTKRLPVDRAEDLVHSFVAEKVLEGDLLNRADRSRGKFRTFLLTSLERYIISQVRKENAARRSPGAQGHVSLDDTTEQIEDGRHTPVSAAFDLTWIRGVIDDSLKRTHDELKSSDREAAWMMFLARVVDPILHGEPPEPYAALIERLGFDSPMQASNALVAAKRIFETSFKSIIKDYVRDESEVDEEIKDLYAILSQLSA